MKVVVIGNGMVGQRFLEQLVARRRRATRSPCSARSRARPTTACSSRASSPARAPPTSTSFREAVLREADVTLRLNDQRARDRPGAEGGALGALPGRAYDKLVLATGSTPFVPPVAGHDRRDCFVYRTIEDLEVITATAARSKVGTVIGGGLLGLEAAKALKDLGLETHVVEFAPRLMAVQLDDSGRPAAAPEDRGARRQGPRVKNTKEIVDGRNSRNRLVFADGTTPRDRPDRVLRRHPAARRAGARRRPRGRRARRHPHQLALPDQQPRHLRGRRVRAVGRAHLRPGGAGLPDGRGRGAPPGRRDAAAVPRRRHEHQAQADGRRRGLDRRRARRDARRAQLRLHRRGASTRSWWSRTTASSCSARSWSATRPTTARCCRWRSTPCRCPSIRRS